MGTGTDHYHLPCTTCHYYYRLPLECMISVLLCAVCAQVRAQHGNLARVRWSCLLSKLASGVSVLSFVLYVWLVRTMTNAAFLLFSHDNLFLGAVSALPKPLSEAMHCVTQASCRRILGRRLWRYVVFQFQERHAVERRSTEMS